jgi:polysaccharide export outer membrane protein
MRKLLVALLMTTALVLQQGCASYKQNIMFKTGEGFSSEPLQKEIGKAESNYVIKKNDLLTLELYANNGEKLVDPSPELSQQSQASSQKAELSNYLINDMGLAKFPMVGEVKLEGLTIRQAEMMLQKEYELFFKLPYVKLKFNNKRVIVLGAPGGQVLPLENENVSLVEVIAMAKGIDNFAKAHNIRVLRAEKIYLIDLSTLEGYKLGNMKIEPGDVVYIEPVRRPVSEGFKDYGPIFTLLASVTTLIAVLTR